MLRTRPNLLTETSSGFPLGVGRADRSAALRAVSASREIRLPEPGSRAVRRDAPGRVMEPPVVHGSHDRLQRLAQGRERILRPPGGAEARLPADEPVPLHVGELAAEDL